MQDRIGHDGFRKLTQWPRIPFRAQSGGASCHRGRNVVVVNGAYRAAAGLCPASAVRDTWQHPGHELRKQGGTSKPMFLERDDFSSNRHPALGYCWSMIFSENRYPLFGIMLWSIFRLRRLVIVLV